jgi:hypothetical protein
MLLSICAKRSLNFLSFYNFVFTRITALLTELYRFIPNPAPILISGSERRDRIKYMATSCSSFSMPHGFDCFILFFLAPRMIVSYSRLSLVSEDKPPDYLTQMYKGDDIMFTLPFRSTKQLVSLIRKKKIGCLELLDLYLQRIERYNSEINAIIFMDVEAARKRARAADKALARNELWGPFHGVPMTIKGSFDVVDMPTTWGLTQYKDNYPMKNAIVVERLLSAGAVIFGKTNVPLYLADWQTFNQIYGTTNNPWDVTRVPGGSSGGSAAALAAGLTGLEFGSDIGPQSATRPITAAFMATSRPTALSRPGAKRCREWSQNPISLLWDRWRAVPMILQLHLM